MTTVHLCSDHCTCTVQSHPATWEAGSPGLASCLTGVPEEANKILSPALRSKQHLGSHNPPWQTCWLYQLLGCHPPSVTTVHVYSVHCTWCSPKPPSYVGSRSPLAWPPGQTGGCLKRHVRYWALPAPQTALPSDNPLAEKTPTTRPDSSLSFCVWCLAPHSVCGLAVPPAPAITRQHRRSHKPQEQENHYCCVYTSLRKHSSV